MTTPAAAKGSVPLAASEERYKVLVQSVRDYAIFLLDADGHVQTWNPGAEAAKGYRADEIIGQSISVFYTEADRKAQRPKALLAQAARAGSVEDEGWRVRKDGSRFWADVVITAIRDPSGELLGYSKVTRDLSEKRRNDELLRQSEERFRVLVQSVKDYAIFMLDPTGVVVSWNPGAIRIKGYTPEEIIGRHFSTFYPPEDVADGKCERELSTAITEGKFEEEGWRVRKDGSRFWASVVIEPMKDADGTLLGFAKVTRDLTERRIADAERLRLAQAQEAVRLRDEFLSIASHELKTPLTGMQLQLQSLLLSSHGADEKLRLRAERAVRSGQRLSDLIDTLLDVSRIATGHLTLTRESFELGDCAADVAERFREQVIQAGSTIEVHRERSTAGQWDRLRVEQVISNLIGNALKYAAGSSIDISVSGSADEAVLVVSDQGPGISQADQSRVFQRFERAASAMHYGGMGLGLYVTNQICQAHGGSIAIEAVVPHGARFVVRLPKAP